MDKFHVVFFIGKYSILALQATSKWEYASDF